MIRLLTLGDQGELLFESFHEADAPDYAILSHTWLSPNSQEPTYQDVMERTGRDKPGLEKVHFCLNKAKEHGLKYCWSDTVCIDKTSAAELSRAINSMFRWYEKAARCYVYLSDVSACASQHESSPSQSMWESAFRQSRWMKRGWTLQELIAPPCVEFFSREGIRLGDKRSLEQILFGVTAIPLDALRGTSLSNFSYDERKAWAATRTTTEPEDLIYCLLGLLEISMPAIYGEGLEKAAARLDREVRLSNNTRETVLGKRRTASQDIIDSPAQPKRPRIDEGHQLDSELITNMIESLRFDQLEVRQLSIKKAHAKTCQWLRSSPQYVQWYDPELHDRHHGFLWIKGKPGSGKSTLMKYALADTRRKMKGTILLSFFFNARGSELERSTEGLYRTLLVQLLEQLPDLKLIFSSLGLTESTFSQARRWNIEMLKDLLDEAFQNLAGHSVVCFIDALDECGNDEVRDMVSFFETIGDRPTSSKEAIHICLASRHYPHITPRWGVLELTLEGTEGHKQDIENYVASELRIGQGKFMDRIRAELIEKASGVFMWVVLVVAILNKEHDSGQTHKIHKRLRELPPDLHTLFRDILTRDSSRKDEMLLCAQWILFANSPLSLGQLYSGIRVGLDQSAPDRMDPEEITPDVQRRFLLNASKGLAEETQGKNPTVQFIHESVRDFLLKEDGLAQMWPKLADNVAGHSHKTLNRLCQVYIHVDLHDYTKHTDDDTAATSLEARTVRASISQAFPLLGYAAKNMYHHAEECLAAGMTQPLFKKLASRPHHRWTWVSKIMAQHETHRNDLDQSAVYIFAQKEHPKLLQHALDSIPRESRTTVCWQALERALDRGQLSAARALLENPVLVRHIPERDTASALFLRSIRKGGKISALLLNAVREISEDLEILKPGLLLAAERCRSLLKPLLDKCADLGAKEEVYEFAISSNCVALVALMLETWKNDVTIKYSGRKELIYVAAGLPEILKLILSVERDTDVNWVGLAKYCQRMKNDEEPPETAYEACQILVEHAADSALNEDHGFCPLHVACWDGNSKLVQLLLERDVRLSYDPKTMYGTIHGAIQMDFGRGILLLLLKQTTAKSHALKFLDMVQHACSFPDETFVHFLFDAGVMADWIAATDEASDGQPCVTKPVQRFVRSLLLDGLKAGLDGRQLTSALIRAPWTKTSYLAFTSSGPEMFIDLLITGASRDWHKLSFEDIVESHRRTNIGLPSPEEKACAFLKSLESFFFLPCRDNKKDGVKLMLDIGVDPDCRTDIGCTILQYIAGRPKHGDIVRLLLERGANANAPPTGNRHSPLVEAFRHGSYQSVLALLEYGAKFHGRLQYYAGYGEEKDALLRGVLLSDGSDPRAFDERI